MKVIRFIVYYALLMLLALPAHALTGRLRGTVKDPEGKPIEKVLISIELIGEISQKYTAHTNSKGEYIHIGVNPGQYRITPSKEGYKPVQFSYIDMAVTFSDKAAVADFVMEKIVTGQAAQPAAQQESEQMKSAKQGVSLLTEGKLDEAIAAFQKALELDPKIASVHYNLALAYERKEQPQEAIKHLEEAIQLRPEFGEAYLALGDLHMSLRKYETASEAYKKAAEYMPGSYATFYNLGVSYSNTGKYGEAEGAYRRACEISPNEPIAHYQLGM